MLENAIILALVIYFIKATTWPGMIFEAVGEWVEKHLGEYWSKPVLGCPVCMTPWWGTAIYLLAHVLQIDSFQDIRIQTIILTVFAAAGISVIILMLNKEYDVAKKEDEILENEQSNNKTSNKGKK